MNNDVKALQAVEKLGQISLEQSEPEIVHGLLCLAAQLSFETGNRTVSELLLEKMLACGDEIPVQSLLTIRCLTRLKFANLPAADNTRDEIKKILTLVEKAVQLLMDARQGTYM